MNKSLFVLFALLISFQIFGQDIRKWQGELSRTVKKDPSDTSQLMWTKGGMVNVNIAQGSLSNWAAGGDKFSLSINSHVNYHVFYKNGKQNWDNNGDFFFGYLQSSSTGGRKNDDRIDLVSKYGYNFDGKFYLTGLFNFRTQLFDGFTYSSPEGIFSSSFLSPAYVLVSAGLDYKASESFSAFFSPITSRATIVLNDDLSEKGSYGVPPGHKFLYEFGAFTSLNYKKALDKNINYRGRLDLFSNYLNNPKNIDIFMTNFFTFKFNKYFSATYNLDMIYDDDVKLFGKAGKSPGLQLKSQVGIGFLKRFK